MLILETERLLLREFVPEDADALMRVLSDAETMRHYPAALDRAGVMEWITRNRRRYTQAGHGLWAMVLKSSGELIGDCGLTRQTVDGVEEFELGYHVRRDLWGRGYAPEAAQACRDYGFERLGTERIISLVRVGNLPSRRVAEKVGMKLWKRVMWRDLEHWVMAIQKAEADASRPRTARGEADSPQLWFIRLSPRNPRGGEFVASVHTRSSSFNCVLPPFQAAWNCFSTNPAS
jgi:RimJ/RimL family protein N-acetyltransferase